MSILLIKLGGIFVKQLSKPLANRLSVAVLANDRLRGATVHAARVRPIVLRRAQANLGIAGKIFESQPPNTLFFYRDDVRMRRGCSARMVRAVSRPGITVPRLFMH
jgi:hypothetical protein